MAETVECKVRKWGSSLGIIIPREVVKQERIKPDQTVRVTLAKQTLARDLWQLGPIKLEKTAQEIKDELRKGW